MSAGALGRALRERELLLLDGAMGTELQRRGLSTELPLWSARAVAEHPEVVLDIHRDYVEAGADIITTNTFRTTGRTCRAADLPDDSALMLNKKSLTNLCLDIGWGKEGKTMYFAVQEAF